MPLILQITKSAENQAMWCPINCPEASCDHYEALEGPKISEKLYGPALHFARVCTPHGFTGFWPIQGP